MTIVEMYTAPSEGAPVVAAQELELVAGVGIAGDRYATKEGTFSHLEGPRREVTLIARESLDRLRSEFGFCLAPGQHRRNIVVEGVDLPALIGREFRLGGAVLRGVDHAAPCKYLEDITFPGLLAAMAQTGGGLRASIAVGATVRVGDSLVPGTAAGTAECTDDCAVR